jgi:tRNA threonylcarbamoyladenosine biosynthesis protein TsaB
LLILSVDTSGREGSVALVRGDANAFNAFEVVDMLPLTGRQYSAELIPQIAAALDRHGISKREVEAYAVVSGPGSFTGLRVGIATVKGLAEVFQRPVAAVSMLEAIALTTMQPGKVIAALDAGRHELFVGEYQVAGERATCNEELLMSAEAFSKLLDANPTAQLITPDLPVAESARFHMQVKQVERPQGDAIARIALKKLAAGETVAPEVLEANYIRRSDAEIFGKP